MSVVRTGQQNICDNGSELMKPGQMVDGVVRHFCGDEPLNLYAKCGTFADVTVVAEQSVIKVDSDLPPEIVGARLVWCCHRMGLGRAPRPCGARRRRGRGRMRRGRY